MPCYIPVGLVTLPMYSCLQWRVAISGTLKFLYTYVWNWLLILRLVRAQNLVSSGVGTQVPDPLWGH